MESIDVEYEDLSNIPVGKGIKDYSIKGHVALQDKLVAYFNSKEGQNARKSSESRVVLREIIKYGDTIFRVETTIRADNLYVTIVAITDLTTGKLAFSEEDDGSIDSIGRYVKGTILVPIQFYLNKVNSRTIEPFSPGTLIRSQAFRISEALRFRRSMRYTQLARGGGHAPLWPEFGDTTPFEYANILRDNEVGFSKFRVFYGSWERLSKELHPVVAVKTAEKR